MARHFDLEEWVRLHGKTYPTLNTPAQVSREQRFLMKIPAGHAAAIPPPSMPIALLISSTTLPSLSLTTASLSTEFSSDPPILSIDNLSALRLPPLAYTQSMLASFGQAWFDGKLSVVDPTNNKLRLPFWILQYWLKMGQATTAKSQWEAAQKWLLTHRDSIHPMAGVVQDAIDSFKTLGWNVRLSHQATNLRSLDIVELLSTQMIHSRVVDAMINSIAEHVRLDPDLHRRISVEDLTFSNIARLDDDRWKQYEHHRCFTRARNLGNRLRAGSLEVVIIPLNKEDIHWAVLFINAPGKWIKHGDTLAWAWPAQDVKRIQQWLNLHGFPVFQEAGSLPHGLQLDSYSCAIGMINIIRNDLFGDPLFTDKNKHFLRIQEYLRLVQVRRFIFSLELA
jgi:hypothetical protein